MLSEKEAIKLGWSKDEVTLEEFSEFHSVMFQEQKRLKKDFIKKEMLDIDSMYSDSIGTVLNYGRDELNNIICLIKIIENSTLSFRVFDNSFVEVTKEQLEKIEIEMITYGNSLYSKKWELEVLIDTATTIEELNEISW